MFPAHFQTTEMFSRISSVASSSYCVIRFRNDLSFAISIFMQLKFAQKRTKKLNCGEVSLPPESSQIRHVSG
jgi:hypothetical protein